MRNIIMINPGISAVWSATKQMTPFSCTRVVQEVHTKCFAKHMINHRISAVWSTTKQIAPFSCTQSVQEEHTKAEVVNLTPALLSLGVLFNCHT